MEGSHLWTSQPSLVLSKNELKALMAKTGEAIYGRAVPESSPPPPPNPPTLPPTILNTAGR